NAWCTSSAPCLYTSIGLVFFFNDAASPEFYTLSLHDALPISKKLPMWRRNSSHLNDRRWFGLGRRRTDRRRAASSRLKPRLGARSEEHTSELQSRGHLVCRLLLEKKKTGSPRMRRRRSSRTSE